MLKKLRSIFRKRRVKEILLENKIRNLDYVLYLQIKQYKNRADTKYHRGVIDALNSVRASIEEILKTEEEEKNNGI